MTVGGLALLAEATGGAANNTPPAWVFGVGAFVVLASLVFVVTRMNIKR